VIAAWVVCVSANIWACGSTPAWPGGGGQVGALGPLKLASICHKHGGVRKGSRSMGCVWVLVNVSLTSSIGTVTTLLSRIESAAQEDEVAVLYL
jgi:hypothetical protein